MKKLLYYTSIILIWVNQVLYAATFNIPNGDVAALISAINTINTNNQRDTLNLATNGVYTLTAVNYTSASPGTTNFEAQRGLPKILETVEGIDLVINGNNATILRSPNAPNFGIFAIKGHTIIRNLTLRNARVNAQGAAIFVEFKGHVEVYNCSFYNNESLIDEEGGGGGIYTKSLSTLLVDGCYFEGNKAVNQGGAISNLLSNMTVLNSTFKNNYTTDMTGTDQAGGAIYDDGARGDDGFLIVRNCVFENNNCGKGKGGALFLFPYNRNTVEVTYCTFKNNRAASGAGYWHDGGRLSLADPFNEYNFTLNEERTSLTFHSCTFDGNIASSQGGGVWIRRGTLSDVYNCTFKNNVAYDGNDGLGGGAFFITERPLHIRNCTFNNNSSKQAGGLFLGQKATLTVTNCTFDNNIAHAYGGAVAVPANDASRAVTFINCTFANNQGNNPTNGQAGAIHSGNVSFNSSVTIRNCLFYNQSVTNNWNMALNCNARLVDGGNNLFYPESNSAKCVTTTGTLYVDPLLSPLANNGGATQTMALQAGSPAIDAASNCPTTDQRGAPRVGRCDIGAFEFGATVSIHELTKESAEITLYPNPAQGKFYIELNAPVETTVTLYTINGEQVYTNTVQNLRKIPIEYIGKGLFILEIKCLNMPSITKRVVLK